MSSSAARRYTPDSPTPYEGISMANLLDDISLPSYGSCHSSRVSTPSPTPTPPPESMFEPSFPRSSDRHLGERARAEGSGGPH